ncbi:MAG: hypothetical protein ABIO70_28735 [Pseudomonadota bacterium]
MRLTSLLLAMLLPLGCQETIGGAVPPAPVARAVEPVAVAASAPAPAIAPSPELEARVEDLELEVAQLKLVIEQMQLAGVGTVEATNVRYQPNRTTMTARDVQAAVDELWSDVHHQQVRAEDMGAPGEGLFDLENGPLGPRRSASDEKQQQGPGGQPGMPPPPPGGMQPPQGL